MPIAIDAVSYAQLHEQLVQCEADGNRMAAEIARLKLAKAQQTAQADLRSAENVKLRQENERLRGGLDAAIRAANLALFVIRKQNVMPNSSWQSGFEKDLASATAARGDLEQEARGDG